MFPLPARRSGPLPRAAAQTKISSARRSHYDLISSQQVSPSNKKICGALLVRMGVAGVLNLLVGALLVRMGVGGIGRGWCGSWKRDDGLKGGLLMRLGEDAWL